MITNRRRYRAAAAVVVVAAVAAGFAFARRQASPRPNVLLIVMDTTRGDRCSFNGYARPTTPRLDEFARDAVVFRDAWSPASWTGPAHASLFTGLAPEHHGFRSGSRRYLPEGTATLARLLADAGYATGCFSNNEMVSPETGLSQGFGTFSGEYQREARHYPWAPETHASAATWARSAAARGRPFFLFINDMEPHQQYCPPAAVAARFQRRPATETELDALRGYGFPRPLAYCLGLETLSEFEKDTLSDLYDAEIAALDDAIGRLLDELRTVGLLDSTLVIVCSDHGESLGEHGLFAHGFGLYRSLLHVPLLIRLPGRFDGGRHVPDPVRLEDVFPTVLEACGVAVPPGLDGASLLRDLKGRVARAWQPRQDDQRELIERCYGQVEMDPLLASIESVHDGRFHYMRHENGAEELYDVSSDPGEERNLAAEAPAEAARLRAMIPTRGQ